MKTIVTVIGNTINATLKAFAVSAGTAAGVTAVIMLSGYGRVVSERNALKEELKQYKESVDED